MFWFLLFIGICLVIGLLLAQIVLIALWAAEALVVWTRERIASYRWHLRSRRLDATRRVLLSH